MKVNYVITVYSEEQEILFRASGVRNDYSTPYYMLEKLGKRYGNCTVEYKDNTNGWKVEKDFE